MSNKQWYTVHSKPRQEITAEQNLQRQGFETYLPKIGLRKRKSSKWVKIVEPLFPRYLFIRVDPGQHSLAPVRSTTGVAGLVRFGNLLQPVPPAVIEYLKQVESLETAQHPADDWPHQPGDKVDILAGPFAGLSGVFQVATGQDRALLLIELLGRQNTATVDLHAIAINA